MKVNYRRTVEKQRQAAHEKWLKDREERLSQMTPEEREDYERVEREKVRQALSTMGIMNSMLGDSPYSKL